MSRVAVNRVSDVEEGYSVRAVLLSVLLLLAPVAGSSPAAAQEPPARQPSQTISGASPFFGGVPTGTATTEPIAISILDAINRALEHNLGLLLSEKGMTRAEGTRLRAFSGLLPNVNGHIAETRQVVNLAAFGFPLPAGIPSIVGPFNVFDARVSVSQAIFDLHAINDNRAEQHNIEAARALRTGARAISSSWSPRMPIFRRWRRRPAPMSARAQVRDGAGALQPEPQPQAKRHRRRHRRPARRSAAGRRASAVTAAQNEFEKSKLQLARLIGLPIGQPLTLVSELPTCRCPTCASKRRSSAPTDRAPTTRPRSSG